jgi:hypothetical protein
VQEAGTWGGPNAADPLVMVRVQSTERFDHPPKAGSAARSVIAKIYKDGSHVSRYQDFGSEERIRYTSTTSADLRISHIVVIKTIGNRAYVIEADAPLNDWKRAEPVALEFISRLKY